MRRVSTWWRALRPRQTERTAEAVPAPVPVSGPELDISPNDPLLAYFSTAHGAVELDTLELDSPAVTALRAQGVKLLVPLVSQGELIGLLKLGPRRSEQEYSRDDRKLLDDLAAHAAPAVRVAQLVREQEAEVRERERMQQELEVAKLIQQQFLPHELPDLPGWHVAAYYKPARAVGGDFYDFIELPGDRVGIVVGDVTDKGVPAALVMATTHSILRAEAPRLVSPAAVLERANDLLVDEMPAHMFVTCLYAVLDRASGKLVFANAGHNLPYLRGEEGVTELRATGMPLGLLPGMRYEESEAVFAPGEGLLLHSDGLAEAHSPDGEMFGFPRLAKLCADRPGGEELIDLLLSELDGFTGVGWEQEDDITLVTVQRTATAAPAGPGTGVAEAEPVDEDGEVLLDMEMPSEAGTERDAVDKVVTAVAGLELPPARLKQLETAVAEATMNAIEHGNQGRPELPVRVHVTATGSAVTVRITDRGGGRPIPDADVPDLQAKLDGLQSPRGWGLFLIKNMVDDLNTWSDEHTHTIELVIRRDAAAGKEASDGRH
jgi:serine phosphatase RsbU (regulator of sigma subunit)/anti-sigma regulatory factor (Ser/Thr protein kinase)